MKKYLICALLALALLSGCITNPPTPNSNNTIHYVPSNVSPEPEENLSSLMNTSENESVPISTNDSSSPKANETTNATINATAYAREFEVNLTSFKYWGSPGWSNPHHAREIINGSGFYLEFDPALPITVNISLMGYYDNASNSFKHWMVENGVHIDKSYESNHVYNWPFVSFLPSFPIPDSETGNYVLTCMNHSNSSSKICLGKEISRNTSHPWADAPFTLDNKTYRFAGFTYSHLPHEYGALFEGSLAWRNCSAESVSFYPSDLGVLLEQLHGNASDNSTPSYSPMCPARTEINVSNIALLCHGGTHLVSGSKKMLVNFIDPGAGMSGCFYSAVDFLYLDSEIELENGKDGVVLDWSTANGVPALKSVFIPSTHPYYAQLLG